MCPKDRPGKEQGSPAKAARPPEGAGFFRALIQSSTDLVAVADAEGTLLYVSPSVTRALGRKFEEMVGRRDVSFVYPEDTEIWNAHFREVVARGETPRPVEIRLLKHDGSGLDIEAWAVNLLDDPDVKGVVLLGRDVTERKRAEEALRESEERFSKVFHGSPAAMLLTRESDRRILDVNPQFERQLGRPRDQILGRTGDELGIWSQREIRDRVLETVFQHGQLRDFEYPFRLSSGELRDFRVDAAVIEVGGERCVIWQALDIADQRRAERALEQSEERFSKAFHASPGAMVITRLRDLKILDVNATFEHMSGYGRDEVVGQKVAEMGWADPKLLADLVGRLVDGGEIKEFEGTFRGKDGREREGRIAAQVTDIDGEPCVVSHTIDVTGRVRAERALLESEERFAKAFHASPAAIAIVRLRDLAILDANPSFERITGVPRDDIIGRRAVDMGFISPNVQDSLLATLREQGSLSNAEAEFYDSSGRRHVGLVSAELTEIGGEPCAIGQTLDITERVEVREALRLSEERSTKAFRASPAAVALIRFRDYQILDVNPAFEQLTGFSRDEAVGRTPVGLGAIDEAVEEKLVETLRERGSLSGYEVELQHRSGRRYTGLVASVMTEIDGEECAIAQIVDITERKQAHDELRLSEERFAKAFRSSPAAMIITRLRDMRHLDINAAFEKTSGYTREEVVGKTVDELPWADEGTVEQMLEMLREKGEISGFEGVFYTKSGERLDSIVGVEIIDLAGEACVICQAVDITDRKRAAQELKQAERVYFDLFENAPDVFALIDAQSGAVVRCNRKFCETLGYSRKEIVGRPALDFVDPSGRDQAQRMFRGFFEGGYVRDARLRLRRRDGTALEVLTNASAVRDEQGKIIYGRAIMRNVSHLG